VFNSTEAFVSSFKSVSGGYLYYPKKGAGGKLLTAEEYERLVAQWERTTGRRGTWTAVGVVLLIILLWTFVSGALALPKWTDWVIIWGCVGGLSVRIFRAAFAPKRLVKDRPDVAPPRPASEARREARAALNWPFVLFFLLASAAVFIGHVIGRDRTPTGWAWLVGSGVFFALYLWIAIRKFRDKQSGKTALGRSMRGRG
jgi:hypothetical protein